MSVIQKLSTRRKAAAKGANDAQKALSELRAMCARLRDERAELEGRPVPLEEAQDGAARAVLAEAERIFDDLSLASLTKPADRRQPSLTLTADQRAALAFAAQAEGVAAHLGAALAKHYIAHGLKGIAGDERTAELARLEGEILAAELAEEAVIREMEAEGAAPLRRADADPRVLLAHDGELK